ncbi:MAG: N(4)-(beta-N-acetylglucosaminyl)-L-asparaginase [Planctomycetota bacterium]
MAELSRRRFLGATAASAVLPAFHISSRQKLRGPVAVASANGLQAVQIAVEQMQTGLPPVDAGVKGVEVVENDPNDMSVGYGGLPNERGVVELDACVMDGPTGLGGAVASLHNIKNPAQVALAVMRHTDHVLLVGPGALEFAKLHGFAEENLLTERARQAWLRWKRGLSRKDDWVEDAENVLFDASATGGGGEDGGKEALASMSRPTGTIHVGCVNERGDVGGVTTTSGLAFKIPGRVGDSPLLGCGNYVDNDVGVAGSTGRGEAVILSNGAATVVHHLALGKSPTDACLEACRRIVRMTKVRRLLDERGRPAFQVKFYAVNKRGEMGAAAIRPSRHARMDADGPRLQDSAAVFDD